MPIASTHLIFDMQGCSTASTTSGLIKELRMYVQPIKTSDGEARHLVRLCDAKCWSRALLQLLFGVAWACLVSIQL